MDFNGRGSIGADNREKYLKEHGGSFTCTMGKWEWVAPAKAEKPVTKKKFTTKKK